MNSAVDYEAARSEDIPHSPSPRSQSPVPPNWEESSFFAYLRDTWKFAAAHWSLSEVSGSFGDLGTFIPITVAMAINNGLDFGSALFFTGLFNFLTGFTFFIPIAVQPMKAIATTALAEDLPLAEILFAGITAGVLVFLLGVTGLVNSIRSWVPMCLIRGIQLGLAITLIMKGIAMVVDTGEWWDWDCYLIAIFIALFTILLSRWPTFPTALVIFAIGFAIAIIHLFVNGEQDKLTVNPIKFSVVELSWRSFENGLLKGGLPQVPLTLLNSVFAVCKLSQDLFPKRPASFTSVCTSVGLMNATACWFGAIPCCHGAGGLAAQYRFGARSNMSIIFLGLVKMAIAVLFGSTFLFIFKVYPRSVLGVLLAFSSLELATVARDQTKKQDAMFTYGTAAAIAGFGSIWKGFTVGAVFYIVSKAVAKREEDAMELKGQCECA